MYLYNRLSLGSLSKNSLSIRDSMRFFMTAGVGEKRALSCRVTSEMMLLWSSTRRAFMMRTIAASTKGFLSSSTCIDAV